ncbi:MAG: thioredoxin domain-containing protein, partial [Bacteroidota bacterium]
CHVMEHESFEDEEVAKLMNERFVNIKIDREERPDIDKIYMDAVMIMTGRGGWPLNAIALPDGRPIFGGTYYPKENWMDILTQVSDMVIGNPQKTHEYADNLTQAMIQGGDVSRSSSAFSLLAGELNDMVAHWINHTDLKHGGRKTQANKFPLPMNNLFLLRCAFLMERKGIELASQVKLAVDTTVEKMALGGIYDQVGGGFSRYSVDAYWKVPHFEKMLYDNGQLMSLYSEAWQAETDKASPKASLYQRIVYQTAEFMQRELTSQEGGCYSSLDADSEGVEGKFYIWTYEEVEQVLGERAKLFADYYNIHPYGNWEGSNILFALETEEVFADRWKLDVDTFKAEIEEGRRKLLASRASRVRPGLDDKILASWNGLMLSGYANAYRVFQENQFLENARSIAAFLREKMYDGEKLFRNYKNGKASITAFLDDYANVIDGLLALYQVSLEDEWLSLARQLLDYVIKHFFDTSSGMFFYTSDTEEVLIKRKMEIQDDVIPSSNAMLAHAFHTLWLITHEESYRNTYQQMLANVREQVITSGMWHAAWAQLVLKEFFPHYEVAITGKQAKAYRLEMAKSYYPNRVFAGAETENDLPILQQRFTQDTTIYVCEGFTCQLPVTTVVEANGQLGL